MPFTFVYHTADIYISALSKLRENAEISAVRYTNLNGIEGGSEDTLDFSKLNKFFTSTVQI